MDRKEWDSEGGMGTASGDRQRRGWGGGWVPSTCVLQAALVTVKSKAPVLRGTSL